MQIQYENYEPKTILNTHKHVDGGWFWDKYSAFPYMGCVYGCEYCYWRDERYNRLAKEVKAQHLEDPFSQYIKIKKNAPELLQKELSRKKKDLIYLDSYQPLEAKRKLVREMLKVCLDLGFPVFINEKSPMVLRDLDILKKIDERAYVNIGFSIITATDNEIKEVFEPCSPPVKARFGAMRQISDNNIMVGTVFMPILPFISDDEENIKCVVKETKVSGGKYVLNAGLTLSGYCKTRYYQALERFDPSLIVEYNKLYNDIERLREYTAKVHRMVVKYCKNYDLHNHIPRPIEFYPKGLWINKKVAEAFYLEARELQMNGKGGYKEWSYRKAAWILDDLDQDIAQIYEEYGRKGLQTIHGIGNVLSREIENFVMELKKANCK